jgi:hypothetical protein
MDRGGDVSVNDGVTLGGWILGTGLIVLRLGIWWPGLKALRKDPAGLITDLGPFVFSWCYGALLIMCAGGLLGGLADVALWGGNWLGDGALIWGVGGQSGDAVTRGTAQVLTNGGHAMVLLGLFMFAVLLKRGRVDAGHVWQGLTSGVLLGLSSGVVGAAAVPLASLVNLAGAWLSTGVIGKLQDLRRDAAESRQGALA